MLIFDTFNVVKVVLENGIIPLLHFGKWYYTLVPLLHFGNFRHFWFSKDTFGKGIFHNFGILFRQALLHIYHSADFQMRNIFGGKMAVLEFLVIFAFFFPFFNFGLSSSSGFCFVEISLF